MQTNTLNKQRDIGSIISCLALIIVAVVFYYDTTTMVDSDSYVFPRAIILMLLLTAIIRVVQDVIAPSEIVSKHLGQNYIRSILLVLTLLVSISLIPFIGFLMSMGIAYFAIMYLAMHERWTRQRAWTYPVVAIIVVATLYLLFVHAFNVQFPEGMLFE